jgi:hypothetical protein
MALRKQNIDLPLAIGLDTKTDPKQTKGLLRMENAFIRKSGELRKRGGKKFLADDVFSRFRSGGEEMVEGFELHNHKDKALLLLGRDSEGVSSPGGFPFADAQEGQGIFAQLKTKPGWDLASNRSRVSFGIERISARNTTGPDLACGSGYEFAAFVDTDVGGLGISETHYTITDETTQAKIFSDQILGASGRALEPRVLHVKNTSGPNSSFILWVINGASNLLQAYKWDPTTPTAAIDPVADKIVEFTDVDAHSHFDVTLQDAGTMVLTYVNDAAASTGNVVVKRIDADGTVLSTSTTTAAAQEGIGVWVVVSGGSTTIFVVYSDTGTTVKSIVLNSLGVVISGPTTLSVAVSGAGDPTQITGVRAQAFDQLVDNIATAPASMLALEYEDVTNPHNSRVNILLLDSTGASVGVSGDTIIAQHSGLMAKGFAVDGIPYFPLVHESTLQPTAFLTSIRQRALNTDTDTFLRINYDAKILANRSGGLRTVSGTLPNVSSLGGDEFKLATLRQDRRLPDGTVLEGVVLIRLDMKPDRVGSVSVGLNTQIAGGVITDHDGVSQELGFHLFPENITENSQAGGGSIGAGTYSYTALFEWTDRNGQLHRSAPAPAITVVVPGPLTTVFIEVPTLAASERRRPQGGPSAGPTDRAKAFEVEIHLFRTEAGGTVFHKTGASTKNDPEDVTKIIGDTISDTDLIKNELLYTEGGVLEANGPRAFRAITARSDRAFGIPYDDPTAIYFTKPKVESLGLEFNDASFIRIERGGDGVALGVLDDNIIVFKEDTIYAFGGAGPNALGEGSFTPPRKISSDVGCIDPRSIVETDVGIFFKSKKGIELLNRSLVASYVGALVEDFNDDTIVSAVLLAELHQVRFALAASRPVLVFDYFHQRWSTYEFGDVVDAVNFQGDYLMVSSTGKVFRRLQDRDTMAVVRRRTGVSENLVGLRPW